MQGNNFINLKHNILPQLCDTGATHTKSETQSISSQSELEKDEC